MTVIGALDLPNDVGTHEEKRTRVCTHTARCASVTQRVSLVKYENLLYRRSIKPDNINSDIARQ